MAQRLLILSCSSKKRDDEGLLPALERYDGPPWQVLRSYLRQYPEEAEQLDVYALSGSYGLIPARQRIPAYDQSMDPARADELRPAVRRALRRLLNKEYTQICLGLSQRYFRAVGDWKALLTTECDVVVTDGPMGMKLGQLRAWLNRQNWVRPARPTRRLKAATHPTGQARLAGVDITCSPTQLVKVVRQGIARGDRDATALRTWYVRIDGTPISPKWLVSQISGVPTSRFDASVARRVLLDLGLDIELVTTLRR